MVHPSEALNLSPIGRHGHGDSFDCPSPSTVPHVTAPRDESLTFSDVDLEPDDGATVATYSADAIAGSNSRVTREAPSTNSFLTSRANGLSDDENQNGKFAKNCIRARLDFHAFLYFANLVFILTAVVVSRITLAFVISWVGAYLLFLLEFFCSSTTKYVANINKTEGKNVSTLSF